MDYDDLIVTSLVSEIFDSRDNPLPRFIETVDQTMNSSTVLLKGRTNQPIIMNYGLSILLLLIRDAFTDLFLEFDRQINRFDYHDWHDTSASQVDFYAGYTPRSGQILTSNYIKSKPISYLGFAERLHWMLRTSPAYYFDHPLDEEAAIALVREVSTHLFGADTWKVDDPPQQWIGLPNWVDQPWMFFDVVPDFLNGRGYWDKKSNDESDEGLDQRLSQLPYFDGGSSDSCVFFYRNDVFYFLLTNGSP